MLEEPKQDDREVQRKARRAIVILYTLTALCIGVPIALWFLLDR